ncbi:hypothetical protein BHE74_00039461 [Ensete ventricosum]|nr:hypothetical protein BHE74_00039461 [Ensete ventricosum]RZS04389.1 hypothetical protein BHM03_00034720 [Ensete ventricosum]
MQERPRALPTPTGVAPTGASYARGRSHMLAAAPARGFGRGRSPPCRGRWSQLAAPCSRPSMGAGRGQPPLQRARLEIVYPCIPDPDGEDEGGQASSSLAVSTRLIFAMKFL